MTQELTFPDASQRPQGVPARGLALSLGALAIPILAATVRPDWMEREGALLVWLPMLLPAFLMTYYSGRRGASLALAAGMAVLALTQVELALLDLPTPRWEIVLTAVVTLVAVCLGTGWLAALLHRDRDRAVRLALTDVLTGLPNRRYLEIFLDKAWAAATRGGRLSLVFFDIDLFKQINDQHGHAEGDRVLAALGEVLMGRTRRMDVSARFGGEEFVSVLVDCDIDAAEGFAQYVRDRLAAIDFGWGRVTVSAGLAAIEDGMGSPDVLLAAADRALYEAKREGRNRTNRAASAGTGSAPGQPASPGGGHAPAQGNGRRVLVVDDEPDSLATTGGLLRYLGWHVTEEGSSKRALDVLLDDDSLDLLVTDVVMPEMSGFTLVSAASRARPALPVLYVSGYPVQDIHWRGTPAARCAFIAKPLTENGLREAMGQLLDGDTAISSSA